MTSTSARDSSAVTGRDNVGWPQTTTRSIRLERSSSASRRRYVRMALSPVRAPLVGSARSGQPACSARILAGGPASSPATRTVRSGSVSSGSGWPNDGCRVGPAVEVHGISCGRPEQAEVQPPSASGVSGSANCALMWTGPDAPVVRPDAVAVIRETSDRHDATCSVSEGPTNPGGMSAKALTASPKNFTWSVVWFALVPRRPAGRSALTTTSAMPACDASRTAGCRFANAVPDVVITGTGRCEVFAIPSARKPALRSSILTCNLTRPSPAAAWAAVSYTHLTLPTIYSV